MAVYSMTGYASAQLEAPVSEERQNAPHRQLGLEIRSVNSRFLDLSFRLTEDLRAQEPMLRSLLTAKLKRGKVEVRAFFVEANDNASLPDPTPQMLQRLCSLQDTVTAWLPDAAPLSVADALRLCSTGSGSTLDWSEPLKKLAQGTLKDLTTAREREGERLAATLIDRVSQLRALAKQAVPLVPQLVEQQRQRFMERWKEAMGLAEGSVAPEMAQDRALTEATAFAIRIDVAEEITRLDSHLDEIEHLLKKGGEVGKRLDFLIQELHREANTLGSKSAAMELTKISVDMKVLIEQMREQVQNIE